MDEILNDNKEQFANISTLVSLFTNMIPEGTDAVEEVEGTTFRLVKKNGKILFEMNYEQEFDDSETLEVIKEYKESIKELDDETFLKATEDLKKLIDIKEFDSLLNQEHFNEEESNKVCDMMNKSTRLICLHLQSSIQDLARLYDRFDY